MGKIINMNQKKHDKSSELTNRLLYHGQNEEYNESVELMFFKLGYKPTFSTSSDHNDLDTIISQDLFDIIIIDNDNIIEIENNIKTKSKICNKFIIFSLK